MYKKDAFLIESRKKSVAIKLIRFKIVFKRETLFKKKLLYCTCNCIVHVI